MELETAHVWKKLNYFVFNVFFFFADDDVKTKDLDIYFCEIFWYKCFCKKIYFEYSNFLIRKDLLERCLLERVKSLVGHLQFMIGQKHNLVRHLILPQVFAVGQNVWSVFCLVGLILILVRNCYLRPGTIVHNV